MEYKYEAYDEALDMQAVKRPSPVRVLDLRRLFLQLVLKVLQ